MSIQNIIYLILPVLVLYFLFTVGFPFLIAFLIALLLEPVVQMLTRLLKGKRIFSSLLVCSLFTVILNGVVYLVVVKGINEGISLSKTLVDLIKENYQELTQLSGRTQSLLASISDRLHLELNDFSQTGVDSVQSLLVKISESLFIIVKEIPNQALDFLIFIIALYLISFSLPTLKRKLLSIFDPEAHHKIEIVMTKLYQAVLGFIRAQIIISFFIFLLTLAGLLILRVKYPIVLATVITIVDILPILGTGSIIIPMSVFNLFRGDLFVGFGLLILYASLVALRRIIEPKILGDAIGIGALAALASMYIGFKLTGFIGLFLGPATIILVQALIYADIIKLKIRL